VSLVSAASAAINIETVPVGNPGNAADTHGAGYGSVAYSYNIGKYEVTARQYTAFLTAVAATDTYGLYNTDMDTSVYPYGCNIKRAGSAGNYTYSVASDWANRPVNLVSFGDAMRFANWLHNGQPTGAQGLNTTEDGAYYLNGATTNDQLQAVTRKTGWQWAVTSKDEWYKAAYHKNDGNTGNYFDYPTGSDSVPSNDLTTPDGGNNANFYESGYTIGSPYYRTEVGEFELSESPYGTFDQGGNVWEWNEAIDGVGGAFRGLCGGAFQDRSYDLHVEVILHSVPTDEYNNLGQTSLHRGFRVSEVPEPATMSLLALGGAALVARRKKN
jgi:hypothetical protein